MSNRDKKLLIYLGATIIVAAVFFFLVRPFLDKIDKLGNQKVQLQSVLNEKRKAFEMQDEYSGKIAELNEEADKILAKFPEDNTEEKSIMFAVNAEKDVPIWYSQVRFAETTDSLVGVESASDVEEANMQATVQAVDEAAGNPVGADVNGAEGDAVTQEDNFTGRCTDLGLSFVVSYPGFKDYINYIKDYEDRIVIKDIQVEYSEDTGLVSGTMTLSQYAILAPDRELPPIETGDIQLGKGNVFTLDSLGGNFDSLQDIMGTLFSGLNGQSSTGDDVSYFIAVDSVLSGGTGKTIGRSNDPSGMSYITSNSNSNENVYFKLTGSDGQYQAAYEMAGNSYIDNEFTTAAKEVKLIVKSTDRMGSDDDVEVALHVENETDLKLKVEIEFDDSDSPRIEVVEQNGKVEVYE